MALQVVGFSREDQDVIQDMATKLGHILSTEGKKEREEWDKLHGMLGRIAGYLSIAGRSMSSEDLLLMLKQKIEARNQVRSDVDGLLLKILKILEERIKAENADASMSIQLLKDLIVLVANELDMFPLCDSIYTEMIQEYTFYEEKVKHMVKSSVELSSPNAHYTVLSVVGAQSSGKSYLLNQLFGTDFPVMNAAEGRKQTTRGILISRCIRPSFLVLDVEGSDGKERGQDTTFEKKSALFALSTSDLMMFNMSVYDVGREQGSCTPLLKTIFQERTKLPPGLTKILVVLRNYDGETPVEMLRSDIMKSFKEIWKSVHASRNDPVIFKDYIEVKVIALPEKNSQSFRTEVRQLRRIIFECSNDHHNRSARVPAPSFSESSKMLWNQINENKRLDIPHHKVMIAIVHCQQIVEDSINCFVSHKDYNCLRTQESPRGFKEVSDKLMKSTMAKYDKETDMYDAAVRAKERQKLEDEIKKILTKFSAVLIHNLQQDTLENFKREFDTNLKTMEESGDLLNYQNQILQSYRVQFNISCEDLKLFDVDYYHKICGDVQANLQSHSTYRIIRVKEERAQKNIELARERADKDVQGLIDQFKEMHLVAQRLKQEIDHEKEKQEKERKRVAKIAELVHQKLFDENEEKIGNLQKEKEEYEKKIRELEENQNGCTIL